jgi:hypothetical protein
MIKKYVLFFVLFCTVHPICVQAMEKDDMSCMQVMSRMCGSVVTWFSVNKMPQVMVDSQCMHDLRSDSRKVEKRLEFSRKNDAILPHHTRVNGLEVDYGHRFFQAKLRPFLFQIDLKPKRFLRYCYYQRYHNREDEVAFEQLLRHDENCFEQLSTHASLFAQCKQEQMDGYSALGVALMAKKITPERRNAFIQKLIYAGFEFTEKDNLLLALYLCDTLSMREKKSMMLVLQDDAYMGRLSVLPYDVRKYIVWCMVGVSKKSILPFLKG